MQQLKDFAIKKSWLFAPHEAKAIMLTTPKIRVDMSLFW